jgi:hypothetical protein
MNTVYYDRERYSDGLNIINGDKFWYKDGLPHREDGPAIIYKNGYVAYCIHGKYHREDGPAVRNCDGSLNWYIDGIRHRSDGPAYQFGDQYFDWFYNGHFIVSFSRNSSNSKSLANCKKQFEQYKKLIAFI